MAATNPLTSRSLLAQAPYPTPRLPSSLRLRPRLSLSNPNQPTTAPKRRRAPAQTHPAFSRRRANKKIPIPVPGEQPGDGVVVTDRGLAYRLDGAPFEFQYSYTEAPRARPVALREAPFLPFGPEATPRPWTGRKPLPKSRKELPEFDSFVLPPHGKKGVKPVQSPGPFLAGMEPRYQAASREEVLGEPLTKAEVAELVQGNLKTRRMLSMGRDGLTHNMLENIHAHWKRKRVCKIKCKGVCTVDMDNVCQQLEDKIGGKVIHRKGGVIFLFRGRNYNHRTRPCFPLMLWKPAAPVYPRLIKIPDGLTPQEATDMRNRGRQLPPICKLGKNGVYVNLVKQVREAFEACDLVRVDCSGLHKSDCRKIGAKLKDLVPCTLLSFEFEHILMLRGNEWKSSLPPLEENNFEVASDQQLFTGKENLNNEVIDSASALTSSEVVNNVTSLQNCNLGESEEKLKDSIKPNVENDTMLSSASANTGVCKSVGVVESESSAATPFEFSPLNPVNDLLEPSEKSALFDQSIQSGKSENGELVEQSPDGCGTSEQSPSDEVVVFPRPMGSSVEIGELETVGRRNSELIKVTDDANSDSTVSSSCMEGVLLLLKQAVDSGSALVLNENEFADADAVYQKSVAFTKTAPRGPVFPRKPRAKKVEPAKYVRINKHDLVENKEPGDVEKKDKVIRGSGKPQRKDDAQDFLSDVVPRGTLRVDELAKLLS